MRMLVTVFGASHGLISTCVTICFFVVAVVFNSPVSGKVNSSTVQSVA